MGLITSRDGCCPAQHPLAFVWALLASPDVLGSTRLDAKFKASVKDGEGWEGTSPAGRWGLVLFEELLQFRWLRQVPFLLYCKICSNSTVL